MAWNSVVDLDLSITSQGLQPDYTRGRLVGIRFDWGQYQSNDGGDNWSGMAGQRDPLDVDFSNAVNNVSHGNTSIGISRSDDGFLDRGPIVSVNSGITWSQVDIWAAGYFEPKDEVKRSDTTLLCTGVSVVDDVDKIAFVRSTDEGASWTRIIPPEVQISSGNGFVRHGDGDRWFFVISDDVGVYHIFISEDNGTSWTESSNAPWELLNDLTWVTGDIVLASGRSAVGGNPQLFRSTNGGDTWTSITPPGFSANDFGNFYISSGNGVPLAVWSYQVIAEKHNQISRSLDAGLTWGSLEANNLIGDYSDHFLICSRWLVSSGGSYIIEDNPFVCGEEKVAEDEFFFSEPSFSLEEELETNPCPCAEEATWTPDVIPSSTFTEIVPVINPF